MTVCEGKESEKGAISAAFPGTEFSSFISVTNLPTTPSPTEGEDGTQGRKSNCLMPSASALSCWNRTTPGSPSSIQSPLTSVYTQETEPLTCPPALAGCGQEGTRKSLLPPHFFPVIVVLPRYKESLSLQTFLLMQSSRNMPHQVTFLFLYRPSDPVFSLGNSVVGRKLWASLHIPSCSSVLLQLHRSFSHVFSVLADLEVQKNRTDTHSP